MYLDTYTSLLIGSAPLPDPKTLQTQVDKDAVNRDPLIAKGWENTAYIGSALLVLIILAAVGWFSRKLEYVIILALFFSFLAIAFILLAAG
jgi:hypothetical protein